MKGSNGGFQAARGVYLYSCPNCGGPVGDDRLLAGLPCPRCLPERVAVEDVLAAAEAVDKFGRLREGSELDFYARVEREARRVEELFEKATGSRLWSAQRAWVRRVLKGKSFAAIAPTGVGKTTFGVLMAVYFASLGEKTYIVVPTTPLVRMVEEKALKLADAAGVPAKIVALHGRLPLKARRRLLEKIEEGDFHILITTSQYMLRNVDRLVELMERWGRGFRFVFVDDVDAVLKSGKSVDAVLRIVGFTRDDIEDGWRLLQLQRKLISASRRAQEEFQRELARLRQAAKRRGRRLTAEDVRRLRRRIFEERLGRIYEELREVERRIEEKRRRAAVLVVSSATGRPRGSRVRLFQVLLGFQAGAAGEAIRNIVDSYTYPGPQGVEAKVLELVRRLGDGGLVYVPLDKGVEYAEKLAEYLRENGVAAEAFTSRNQEALDKFRSGETSVLVGVAVYYGVAVRGLDLPERIRYAVFAGVPRLKFSARFEEPHPVQALRALAVLAEHAPEDVASQAQALLAKLRSIARRLSQAALQRVAEELRQGRLESDAAREFAKAVEWIRTVLRREDVWKALEEADDIAVVREEGKAYILVPDVATYIQASGRTSRLFAGGITKGLSVVVVDDQRLFNGLARRTKWLVEAEWKRFEELDLPKLLREIDEDRRRVRDILEGRIKPEFMELVKTALMIVESPNKARTIAGFFGRPSVRQIGPLRAYEVSTGDYVLLVAASGGHVYDLVKPPTPQEVVKPTWLLDVLGGSVEGYPWGAARNIHGVLVASGDGGAKFLPVYAPLARCLACGHQWTVSPEEYEPSKGRVELRCPVCGSPLVKSSLDIVRALRDIASEVDVVLVGTDPDTEGEKIGWDIASLVRPMARSLVRIEFHEITRRAITEALKAVREFDTRLVEAQIVRRVEDRWIGFTLSPLLWTKFWPYFCRWRLERRLHASRRLRNLNAALNEVERLAALKEECMRPNYNLSAGRVQTPVLGWIVERTLTSKYLRIPVYRILAESNGSRFEIQVRGDEVSPEIKRALEETMERLMRALKEYNVLESLEELDKLRRRKRSIIVEFNRKLREEGEVRVEVSNVEEWVEELKPLPPFTTDTMLAEAASQLRMPAPEAMRIAQDLFELGLITYHRTDSTRVSDAGIAVAREYLRYRYGEESLDRVFQPRHWGAGGAHEAIRPTRPIDTETLRRLVEEGAIQLARPLTQRHYRLYDLIFRRFIASQMKPAKVRKQKAVVTVEVSVAGRTSRIERVLERVVEIMEKGWLDINPIVKPEPPLSKGPCRVVAVSRPRVWSPQPLLTQADVVRMMKERGIGRPSTYAKIIDTLQKRGYTITSPKRGTMIATSRGIGVYDFLMKRFDKLVSEETTRRLQKIMDSIEAGAADYEEVLEHVLEELREALHSPKSGLTREEARKLLPL